MMAFPRLVSWSAAACLCVTLSSVAHAVQSAQAPSGGQQTAVVSAPAGKLEGQLQGDLRVFKGIPFAAPPVGELRWKPPVALPPWTGVRQAAEFGPECFQPKPQIPSVYTRDPMPMSEDCLTLNIWSPREARHAPVFFWIHGGALSGGSSRDPVYDGSDLAAQSIIVVSINYRLGVLGWLAHPELSKESPLDISGNYGLLDQIEALKWVKSNIGAFGGDASNVTIAGESAGALSVMYLMTSPLARDLFSKAIAESAYMITTPELKKQRFGTPSAEESGTKLAASLHAADIAALRAMDPGKLTEAATAARFGPWGAIDGHILPDQLVDVFDRGEQAKVPMLAGFNSGEIRSLKILAPPTPASADAYEHVIREQFGDLAPEFLRLYPSSNMKESILATTRDALYGWTTMRLVKKQAALGEPSYLYLFDHGYPAEDSAGLHAFHASELPYVFGTLDRTPPLWPKIPDTAEEKKLSAAMVGYWSSFARAGRPLAKDEPAWPIYGSSGAYMKFAEAPQPATGLMPGMFELNEEIVCRRRAGANQPWNWNSGLASPKLPDKSSQCH